MDRFEILKYTILFEEAIKDEMISLLETEGGDANKIFDINFRTWKTNANYVSIRDSSKLAIWKCSHGEFNNLFRALKTSYSSKFYEASAFKGFTTNKRSLNKLIEANRIVRNTLAHPLRDLTVSLNKISNFNSFGRENGHDNIVYFYNSIKEMF